MKIVTILSCSLLGACSNSQSDRYQYVSGSRESIDLVFDRTTGCVAEIKRRASEADVPDWIKEYRANHFQEWEKSEKKNPSTSLDFHGSIDSFEPWHCPQAPDPNGGVKK